MGDVAMLMNWMLVAVGFLISDVFSGLFDGSSNEPADTDEDAPEDMPVAQDENPNAEDPLGIFTMLTDGNDDFVGGEGDDTILGEAGQDSLIGGGGSDFISGDLDDDSISGGDGDDFLSGGAGADTIEGNAGNDVLSSDLLSDEASWANDIGDHLFGNDGDDRLFFAGQDMATGGAGADSFGVIATGIAPAQITDFEVGVDNITLYVEDLNEDDPLPTITSFANAETDRTEVLLDGVAVIDVHGLFSLDELDVRLTGADTIDFGLPAAV